MLRYFINIIFLLSINLIIAQQPVDSTSIAKDTIRVKQPVKLRFGFDIGNYLWAKYHDSKSINFYADANFYKDFFLQVYWGMEQHLTDNSLLNYHTNGQYFKLGIAYNLYRNWLDMDNEVIIGLQYGSAQFENLLHSYRINQPGAIYSPEPVYAEQTFDNNSAQWLALDTQIQVETFKHIYLGYAVTVNYLLHTNSSKDFDITYIPGFHHKNAYENWGFGMQYFISYRIKF